MLSAGKRTPEVHTSGGSGCRPYTRALSAGNCLVTVRVFATAGSPNDGRAPTPRLPVLSP